MMKTKLSLSLLCGIIALIGPLSEFCRSEQMFALPSKFPNDFIAASYIAQASTEQTINGRLNTNSTTTEDGNLVNGHVLQGKAGQRINLELTSTDVDMVVLIFSSKGEQIGELGKGRTIRLTVTFPEDGEYLVAVGCRKGNTGTYTLRIRPV